ncbi:MAG: proline--tRNA ligase [Chloroflexi bacterium]|nr:proline--tRNA ligase [Chloroflexota bacterium]
MAELEELQEGDIAEWYSDVIVKAQLADYSAVRGCVVIRPYAYSIWENMQRWLDDRLKATNHQNAYFPLFIPLSFIQKEKEHVEGFAPQLAVVTHGGGQELAEPLVVRPTSETIIYDTYRSWVQSYRDLPLLINQWCNVVRWELRTRPFLRSMEFLWQEGHTAHATPDEAVAEARLILDIYTHLIQDLLAIPVLPGRKSPRERFAGARDTYTVESLMRDGKALQMGTSHDLGQNFAQAFDVWFLDRDGVRRWPWSTSWAVTTRLLGALVLAHGDRKGLLLPPRLAPIQVVIVPIARSDEQRAQILAAAGGIAADLKVAGVRVQVDSREEVTPGFKFNDWELRGVPLRLELGPRDIQRHQVVAARRDTAEKAPLSLETLKASIPALLEEIQIGLFQRALRFRDEHTFAATTLADLEKLDEQSGFYLMNWCGGEECELRLADFKATIRCIPLDETLSTPTGRCAVCGGQPQHRVAVAKAY